MNDEDLFGTLNDTRGDPFHGKVPLSGEGRYHLVLHESNELA